jgi:single-stranded-DNA-specific exonuclease
MMVKIKNLDKVAKRIQKAVRDKEKIIIYGDSDMDGVSSVIILKETLTTLGFSSPVIYFPDREDEGYGINESALEKLKQYAPALFITLDCGISNFKEAELAGEMSFEVVIIDHHEILDKLPKASIIVDPKQTGDKYPFKEFANVGLTFKLSEAIMGDKMPKSLKKSFLELVAMATIADMMPKTDDNEQMIFEGMGYLEESWRPGIQALFSLEIVKGHSLLEKIIKVNSLMNIRNVQEGLPAAYRLLTSSDFKVAQQLAEYLLEKSIEKKKRVEEITAEVRKRQTFSKDNIVFDGDFTWDLILLGIVAAVVSKDTNKPAFLYKKMEKESLGSIRAPEGFNTVEAMKSCANLLVSYGGHARASGFRLENKNLEKFKQALIEYFAK